MDIKTKNNYTEKNDLETNHFSSIPIEIQEIINERWFYLYNWIWINDVKWSIERDFLKIINKFGLALSLILIFPSLLFTVFWSISFLITYIIFFVITINFFIISYLIIIWIKRSVLLSQNAYILLTDSSFSLNWNINKLKNNKVQLDKKILSIEKLFEEKLFRESNIPKTKEKFLNQAILQFTWWFKKIIDLSSKWSRINNSWKESQKLILLLLWLYIIYILSLLLIYFVAIFFIAIFLFILSVINKMVLSFKWHKVTNINSKFEQIYKDSIRLNKEKEELLLLLKDAINNNWKDSLLTKINLWIKEVNKYALNSVDSSLKLKEEITSSKYKEMFNFSIYNSWIKKQIISPLEQIKDLLDKNLTVLEKEKLDIEDNLVKTKEDSLTWALLSSKKRVEMRINDIKENIEILNFQINKL